MNRNEDYSIIADSTEYTGINPKKFVLWLSMAAMSMFFAALLSALIFKRGDFKSWEEFKLPKQFLYSTVLAVLTSISFQFSLMQYRRRNFSNFRRLFSIGLSFAVAFLLSQLVGWHALTAIGKPINGNISGQFIYLLSYSHAFHIVIGLLIAVVFYAIAIAVRKKDVFETNGKVNPERQLHLELLAQFWHFIDAVWIVFYLFFLDFYK